MLEAAFWGFVAASALVIGTEQGPGREGLHGGHFSESELTVLADLLQRI